LSEAGAGGYIRPRGEASTSFAWPEMVEAMAASTSLLSMPFHIAPKLENSTSLTSFFVRPAKASTAKAF
jgi:hypothetical protein